MTIQIDVNPELEARLREAATRQGLGLAQYASQILQQNLPPLTSSPQNAALALMQKWDREDETQDPSELARRHQEFEDLKAALNHNRLLSEGPSARKLFP